MRQLVTDTPISRAQSRWWHFSSMFNMRFTCIEVLRARSSFFCCTALLAMYVLLKKTPKYIVSQYSFRSVIILVQISAVLTWRCKYYLPNSIYYKLNILMDRSIIYDNCLFNYKKYIDFDANFETFNLFWLQNCVKWRTGVKNFIEILLNIYCML